MNKLADNRAFIRFLEIIPGAFAWTLLLAPFVLAPFVPTWVAYFILAFNLYWFAKAMNVMRHMVAGFRYMWRNMVINWLDRAKAVTENPIQYHMDLLERYQNSKDKKDYRDFLEIDNLAGNYEVIKPWDEVIHAVFVTNCFECYEVTEPTYEAIKNSNYPNDKIMIVSCGEGRDKEGFTEVKNKLKKKYGDTFLDIQFYLHEDLPGDVIGKGPNLYSAGHKFLKHLQKNYPKIRPENVLITTLDADHIVHPEYFSILTYKYIIDANRHRKTYQPIPLLFNNIWDAPAPNRVLSVASSFWQIVESVRPYRLRTFAAHAQSLKTLIITDFWSSKTIVEDGHQYWRTYFAYNGDHEMVPLLMPVYQDCVLAETFTKTLINQYKQRRRWAWGISDFTFIVRNFMKHPEISLIEKFLQTFRHIGGHISWSTASFLIAFAWVPLVFNDTFQDTVLAHNVTTISSGLLRLAWVGLIANIWIYLLLLPPKPDYHGKLKYISMVGQYIFAPIVAIFFSALPAFESQTRFMLGKKLDVFWVTPKIRVGVPKNKH
jgi:hypothetical protein